MFKFLVRLLAVPAVTGLLAPTGAVFAAPFDKIQTVVVIYGENRSFDNLYGLFPGADGIDRALQSGAYRQVDRDGKELDILPPVWKKDGTIDLRFPVGLPNAPFRIDAPPVNLGLDIATPDPVHKFYQNQEQIDGGRNDKFAAVSNVGALVMGYYDGSQLPLWKIAQQYTLADNFFMGAFGGSFLNHFWLVCACTPTFPDAPPALHPKLDTQGRLVKKADGPPKFADGAVTPDDFAVNTLQPLYPPSGTSKDPPLPPQTQKTIGDTLSARDISWKWYSGGWNQALADPTVIYNDGKVNFQPHHQPFNYFVRFAPGAKDRELHLKDETDLLNDIKRGKLPQVVFYKPQGDLNEHPGYADVLSGDEHIAELIAKLQVSPQWKHMVIIVTYDENGGFWDHVAPPPGDRWGPGTRIPAIIVSPYAKKGYVDHTLYDTTSILKLLTERFHLEPLKGVRDYGDLSNAFNFTGK